MKTMDLTQNAKALIEFIAKCPTAYQTVKTIKETLKEQGFVELFEHDAWHLTAGGKYFVTRNGSSIIALCIPQEPALAQGYQIIATHGDAPCFKLKPAFEKRAEGGCLQWNVEKYGGMICSSWMDRPLSVAGRVVVAEDSGVRMHTVDLRRDVALIPNVAIHMDRSVNDGKKFNPQVDMLPLVGLQGENTSLLDMIAAEIGTKAEHVMGHDLFLYVRDEGKQWGMNHDFVSAPRIDNLMCTYGAMQGFLAGAHPSVVSVLAVFDNEEIGSSSRQGAGSSLLRDTLTRVDSAIATGDADTLRRHLANSCILSADNAHAVHPNHPEYADAQNRPVMGGGIVVKTNAAQRYATDAVSAAIFTRICAHADVKTQSFANRSDMPGGSTLGNIAVSDLPALTVDIGLAQLAMHSAYETAHVGDLCSLIQASRAFYHTAVTATADGDYRLDICD
jgi:aspartyl aminopeptidase